MTKKSTIITNLLVIPLIASTVLLASPALAADPTNGSNTEIRHKTHAPHLKKGVGGQVISVNGSIIIVKSKDDMEYTVDASDATIMKVADGSQDNPDVVTISDIQVGDAIFVRGKIHDNEVDAEKIFDGKDGFKHGKHHGRGHK